MDKFLALAKARQSCRAYEAGRTIPQADIDYIIECTRQSPSACNSQPYSFIFVTEAGMVADTAKLAQMWGGNKFAPDASAFAIIIEEKANLSARVGAIVRQQEFASVDIGLACAHLVLGAEDVGVASCILGLFDEKGLKKRFGIDKGKRVRLVVALGYKKAEDPVRNKIRKAKEEVFKQL